MLNRHKIPVLALCAAVAAFTSADASAHGFGGFGGGFHSFSGGGFAGRTFSGGFAGRNLGGGRNFGVVRTARSWHPIVHPTLSERSSNSPARFRRSLEPTHRPNPANPCLTNPTVCLAGRNQLPSYTPITHPNLNLCAINPSLCSAGVITLSNSQGTTDSNGSQTVALGPLQSRLQRCG
jgi:hypothetical protein